MAASNEGTGTPAPTQEVTLDRESMQRDFEAMMAKKAEPAPAAVAPQPGVNTEQPLGDSPRSNIWEDALKAEEPTPEPEDSDAEDLQTAGQEEEGQKKPSGYQRLKNQNAQLQQQLGAFQQQMNQITQAVGPQLRQLQEQNAYLNQQLQQLMAPPPPDPNDPFQRLQKELAPGFQQQLAPVLEEVNRLREQTARYEQERQDAYNARQRAEKRQQYEQGARAALDNVLLKDVSVEDPGAQQLFSKAVTLLALADKTSPEEAARKLRRGMFQWAKGFEQGSRKVATEKVNAGARVPQPAPESNTRAQGDSWPTMDELAMDGRFANYMKWDMAGRPPLRKK